ncbi:hypothetical protein HF319_00490 [Xanthomonas sp. Kuri4-1]
MSLSPEALKVVDDFQGAPGVTPGHVEQLKRYFADSPELARQLNEAVDQKRVSSFRPLTDPHAGGSYDPVNRSIQLPLAQLASPAGVPASSRGNLTFVLGHELQHSAFSADAEAARQQFLVEARTIARGSHDYTAAAEKVLSNNREDESRAQIAGWNATVSRVRGSVEQPTLEDIYRTAPGRMRDFIDTSSGSRGLVYAMKPNLVVNEDMTLSATPANIEAMGKNYFDKASEDTQIGHGGRSDYPNHYGTWVIGTAAIHERHYSKPQPGMPDQPMILDMQRLGLKEDILERNGIDLGSDTRPMPYLDSSTQPPRPGLFQHSRDTHLHVSPISARELEQELRERDPQARSPTVRRDPSRPGHDDHALYQQIKSGVERLDAEHGRGWDASSQRMTASLLALAKEEGLSRVDHVVLNTPTPQYAAGEKVFVVQGALNDPAHRRADMETLAAVQAPEAQSFERVQAFNQARATAQTQQLPDPAQVQAETHSGPSLSR